VQVRRLRLVRRLCPRDISISKMQVDALRNYRRENVRPQVDEVVFPYGKWLIVLSEGGG